MTILTKYGFNNEITDAQSLGNSVVNDHTLQNMKKLCFIVYFALTDAYVAVFCKSLFGFHEDKIMNNHGIRYSAIDCDDSEKGCVEVYGCKLHNEIVSRLRRKIKRLANFQMEKTGKHPRRYLISLNGDSDLQQVRRYVFPEIW